ncbi:MAG: glycosyltransferase family 4 protein [Candidatus Binatia bacterium]|nr:glycosyltransferase family 4 protein [Candidatus Binatia bacterium]
MKVLHVDPEYTFGGGETQVLALVTHLRQHGHTSVLATPTSGELGTRAAAADFLVEDLRAEFGHDPRGGFTLRRLVRAHQPDIVHLHTARALSLAAYRPSGTPAVVTRRMDYAPRGARAYVGWLYNQVDRIIAVSQAACSAMGSRGVAPERVTVVPSGVAVDHFAQADRASGRAALSIDAEQKVVSIVGSLHARKGHSVLLKAVAALRGEGLDVLCLAAGEGPEHEALNAQARTLGLSERVRLLGHIEDVLPVLAAADVVAQPSVAEGLGVAAVEGMASGRPVVASRVGGLMETIRHDIEGLLVPIGDVRAFADGLGACLRDPELSARLGAAGRLRAAQFSTEAMARGNEAVYERLLVGRPARESDS